MSAAGQPGGDGEYGMQEDAGYMDDEAPYEGQTQGSQGTRQQGGRIRGGAFASVTPIAISVESLSELCLQG